MRNGLFAAVSAAMLVVTFAPRGHAEGVQLQVAWLAQRESVAGDWEAVKPPLREGDELQLNVLGSEDLCVYVLDGKGNQLFPSGGGSPRIQAHWPYAIPGAHRGWRLDGGAHDRLYLVAARHPIADPAAAIRRTPSDFTSATDLILPLRDGRLGGATTRRFVSADLIVDEFEAR